MRGQADSGLPQGAPQIESGRGENGIGEIKSGGRQSIGGDGTPSGEVRGGLKHVADARLALELQNNLARRWRHGKYGQTGRSRRKREKGLAKRRKAETEVRGSGGVVRQGDVLGGEGSVGAGRFVLRYAEGTHFGNRIGNVTGQGYLGVEVGRRILIQNQQADSPIRRAS